MISHCAFDLYFPEYLVITEHLFMYLLTICMSFFFLFFFIFKLYITVLDLPNIKMNPPQVYMCVCLL